MKINFSKNKDGLVPAIVQDAYTKKVLMLGYMNEEAFNTTQNTKRVTFYSRSKQRLWTKGETSNKFLHLISFAVDCDNDSLLLQVEPQGPCCHTGSDTCWDEKNEASYGFLSKLESIIQNRMDLGTDSESYVADLHSKGINKISQKVGEEAVEVVIEALGNNVDLLKNEVADLLFHIMILLRSKQIKLESVIKILQLRNQS